MQAPLENAHKPAYGPRTWIVDADEAAVVAHAEQFTGQTMHLLRERPTSRTYRTADQAHILTFRAADHTRDAIRQFKATRACRPPYQPPNPNPAAEPGEPHAQAAAHRPRP